MLDGLDATSHWAAYDRLAALGANPTEERVVERGKVITAAGVSAGIDMGLTLVARMFGDEVAKVVQLAIEYDPQPPFDSGISEQGVARHDRVHPRGHGHTRPRLTHRSAAVRPRSRGLAEDALVAVRRSRSRAAVAASDSARSMSASGPGRRSARAASSCACATQYGASIASAIVDRGVEMLERRGRVSPCAPASPPSQ